MVITAVVVGGNPQKQWTMAEKWRSDNLFWSRKRGKDGGRKEKG